MMLLVQNPFLEVKRQQNTISLEYAPEMRWKSQWGPFETDEEIHGCIHRSGVRGRCPLGVAYNTRVHPF
jgi:hypothetical protein